MLIDYLAWSFYYLKWNLVILTDYIYMHINLQALTLSKCLPAQWNK